VLYESDIDRGRQSTAAWIISNWSGCQVIETCTEATVDLLIIRDDILTAIGEYKWRETRYDTLKIDVRKLEDLVALHRLLGVKPMLFIEWGETGIWRHEVDPQLRYERCQLKRNNMRDANDEDETFIIPGDRFKIC
jgi:hypothetical protein